ncbi:MAG: tRNA threonylcarbamoyladenosine dehydratase [Opitutales bacterium]|nr:tRNA threonylcarbamoyladenosine dehydratase [Opitutales bacterium]
MMTKEYLARFAGIARLYGLDCLERLSRSRVWLVGVGGVGSWTCEALARGGVGFLRLIDCDCVCESNINRQLCALGSTLGQPKVEVLSARAREINPWATIETRQFFVTEETAGTLFESEKPDLLVDAIDGVVNKAALIAACRDASVPVVSSGGCAGKRDAARVERGDLSETQNDNLLKFVRRTLRSRYAFPKSGAPMNVPCVFSRELSRAAIENADVPAIFSPAGGKARPGTAAWVTGAFGLALAQLAVERLLDL